MIAARGAALTIVVLVSLPGCVAPAFNASQYESKAAKTADAAVSAIESVRLALESAQRHELPSNPIDVAIADQEDILGSVSGTFSSVQPPDRAMDRLRDRVLGLVDDAQSKIETARIAFRRGLVDTARAAIESAEKDSKALDEIASRY